MKTALPVRIAALAAVCALFACEAACASVSWKLVPGTVRTAAAYNKLGERVDTRVNIGMRYTNDGKAAVSEIDARHVWYEGEIEIIPADGEPRVVEFAYDEEYPNAFAANLGPGESRTRNYVILLSADGVIKDYDTTSKYRIKSIRAVRHDFVTRP